MKKVYLVGKVNNEGYFTGSLSVFSSVAKANAARDFYNNFFKTSSYIVESHNLE